jgi:hypothetical protein
MQPNSKGEEKVNESFRHPLVSEPVMKFDSTGVGIDGHFQRTHLMDQNWTWLASYLRRR